MSVVSFGLVASKICYKVQYHVELWIEIKLLQRC